MEYSEQLQTSEWYQRRSQVIMRDQRRCQNCFNSIYASKFHTGLVTPKSINKGGKVYFLKAWDFKNDNNVLLRAFQSTLYNSYYVAYFQTLENSQNRLLALRNIDSKSVKLTRKTISLNDNDWSEFLKQPYTSETEKAIYSTPSRSDTWAYVADLHVHHRYYQNGRMAWEYPDDALVTLCWSCHEELHATSSIPHLDIYGNIIGELTPCNRCLGAGHFPEYNHVQSGICFRCNGARFEEYVP